MFIKLYQDSVLLHPALAGQAELHAQNTYKKYNRKIEFQQIHLTPSPLHNLIMERGGCFSRRGEAKQKPPTGGFCFKVYFRISILCVHLRCIRLYHYLHFVVDELPLDELH